jgi:phosphopantothenoylcysteine decarboxylase
MSKIILGVTGSVAAIRTPWLSQALIDAGHEVRVVATDAAVYFFDPAELASGILIRDADEWPGTAYQRDDPVKHIDLRRWADVLVIAPLDANTLAKLAMGLSDNCLTCVWRAWDPARPVLLAPAMNTMMWQHPLSRRHLRQLAADATGSEPPNLDEDALVEWINRQVAKLRIVGPISKRLACGDVGPGAMAEVDQIVAAVAKLTSPTTSSPS